MLCSIVITLRGFHFANAKRKENTFDERTLAMNLKPLSLMTSSNGSTEQSTERLFDSFTTAFSDSCMMLWRQQGGMLIFFPIRPRYASLPSHSTADQNVKRDNCLLNEPGFITCIVYITYFRNMFTIAIWSKFWEKSSNLFISWNK